MIELDARMVEVVVAAVESGDLRHIPADAHDVTSLVNALRDLPHGPCGEGDCLCYKAGYEDGYTDAELYE